MGEVLGLYGHRVYRAPQVGLAAFFFARLPPRHDWPGVGLAAAEQLREWERVFWRLLEQCCARVYVRVLLPIEGDPKAGEAGASLVDASTADTVCALLYAFDCVYALGEGNPAVGIAMAQFCYQASMLYLFGLFYSKMRIQQKAILLGSDAAESFANVVAPDCVMEGGISSHDLQALLKEPLARENGLHVTGITKIYGMNGANGHM